MILIDLQFLQFLCKTSPNIYDINRLLETILFSSAFFYIVTGTSPILWQFLSLLVLYNFIPIRPSYIQYFTNIFLNHELLIPYSISTLQDKTVIGEDRRLTPNSIKLNKFL